MRGSREGERRCGGEGDGGALNDWGRRRKRRKRRRRRRRKMRRRRRKGSDVKNGVKKEGNREREGWRK